MAGETKEAGENEREKTVMIYRRGKYYWFKFMFNGQLVRASTKVSNAQVARNIESARRTALAKGEVGIKEKKPAPTLVVFLKKEFLPFAETRHAAKPATLRYYKVGAASLTNSNLATMRLDEITDQHAQQYAAKLGNLSPSTINCGLRTLRRALYLAAEWGTIDRRPKISLADGEKQRDRVLTNAEVSLYLSACEQPWRDVATIMLGTAMRPGEVFTLRWENINRQAEVLQIVQGKSAAARRVLPMMPIVRAALDARWREQGKPKEGWVFPSGSSSGHLARDSAKNQHGSALDEIAEKHTKGEGAELKPFPPYVLRHTALTRLGESGCDAFTLARIAGHSNIHMTARYVHPQAEAIQRAFDNLAKSGRHKIGHTVKPRLLPAARSTKKAHE
jgi:integrase